MNPVRPEEWNLLQPLDGVRRMLELGNKKNTTVNRSYKDFFVLDCGIDHTSVDWNGQDGALTMDLRKPLNLGEFDMVTNIGTSEHVSEQEPVWRNMVDATKLGGLLCCVTPTPGFWCWHGQHYPKHEFYRNLAANNGFEIERLYDHGETPTVCTYFRARRIARVPFRMVGGIYRNHVRPRDVKKADRNHGQGLGR